MHSVPIILEHRHRLLHMRAFLAHGHRHGKKPGDKEYSLANQLKKKCKKKQFQGIHDRFLQDQEFRIRMIENHRDEEVCRRWDALADEDHTHHLTRILPL